MYFTRLSVSFKTHYAFSSVFRHNASVLLAFLHRFRRLTRFPPYGVINPCISHVYLYRFRRLTRFPSYGFTMRVFFTFLCTRVSYRLRRLTRFPLYGVKMRVYYSRFCIGLDVLRVFPNMGS